MPRLPRALVLLAVAAVATGIVLAVTSSRGTSTPAPAATTAAAPPPTAATAPAPRPEPEPKPAPKPKPTERPAARDAWPAGRDGWTDVLASVAVSAGRAAADADARAARQAGLPRVGVLLSSRFSSLRPGYWVVFSGVYGSERAATAALATVRSRGFTDAYPRRIAR